MKMTMRKLSQEEIRIGRWKMEEMQALGIEMHLDEQTTEREKSITEFNSYDDYQTALLLASMYISKGERVPEPMRSKLISVKKKLDEKGLTVLV